MASATFTNLSGRKVGSVETLNSYKSTITQVNYSKIQPSQVLPFKVRFTNVQIQGYDANNPAPIGIAIIGVNYYIL